MTLPHVPVLSLGGTIAMTGDGGEGVVPTLTGDDLVAAVPGLSEVAEVSASSFRQLPGAHLSLEDLVELAGEIDRLARRGATGFVVTQGTDTIEETAFFLDLLVASEAPVVVTGAMRNPALPGADGPANLLGSVQVAASSAARGLGPLVVINDEIHAARFVRKAHTQSPAAFVSFPAGPVGWLAEGVPHIVAHLPRTPRLPIPDAPLGDPVALVTLSLGGDDRLLRAVASSGYAGLVVEALGGGHAPAGVVEELSSLADRMPVVLSSRAGGGEILRSTYGFPGSETDLIGRGLVPAGPLDGPKARLLLTLMVVTEPDPEGVAPAFRDWIETVYV